MDRDRYKEAGVDIEAAARLVDRIAPLARRTSRPEVMGGLGGFGALFNIPVGKYQDLVLVSGTDGCGTKVSVAQEAKQHSGIGIDLVAMCVNDVVCAGAEPFFFLDYFACGRLDTEVAAAVIGSIAEGCEQAGCALVGGETAEMPGVYPEGVYDLAGFCVGGVERRDVMDVARVRLGMTALGLKSSGLHSNGYSLARKIVAQSGLGLGDTLPGTSHSLGEELLRPTRIYVKAVLRLLREHTVGAVCHITGGGFIENLPRVLPEAAAIRIDASRWERPPIFRFLQERGELSDLEMHRTFNCGIGMVVLVPSHEADDAEQLLGTFGQETVRLGDVARREPDGAQVVIS